MIRRIQTLNSRSGPIRYERSLKARRINISIKPNKGVRVAVPVGVSFRKAEKFVLSKQDWIKKHVDRIKNIEANKASRPVDHPMVEAKIILEKRVKELAAQTGFKYNRVSVKSMTSRWGSCSNKKNINLNVKIMHLDSELRDYIILHELTHTLHPNHGQHFWAKLNSILPNSDAKNFTKKLKVEGLKYL